VLELSDLLLDELALDAAKLVDVASLGFAEAKECGGKRGIVLGGGCIGPEPYGGGDARGGGNVMGLYVEISGAKF
jgi:hypothetical protein